MARRPVAFFDVRSIMDALDAAESKEDRDAVFDLIGQHMVEELEALERNREEHRPPEIRIERREQQ